MKLNLKDYLKISGITKADLVFINGFYFEALLLSKLIKNFHKREGFRLFTNKTNSLCAFIVIEIEDYKSVVEMKNVNPYDVETNNTVRWVCDKRHQQGLIYKIEGIEGL